MRAILKEILNGAEFRKAIMKKHEELEKDDDEFISNRKKLTNYLELLSETFEKY